ncbi:MAG TPA: hypothetical protein VG713_10725 [Pirellulales bacterium]|nr:hypothetical protein [Pirellulales bacterium]
MLRQLSSIGLVLVVALWSTVRAFEPAGNPQPRSTDARKDNAGGKESAGGKYSASGKDSGSAKETKGEKNGDGGTKKNGGKKTRHVSGFTEEREAAALTFVRTHYPELAELIEQLKDANPVEYQRAIRDLFLSSERLAQIEERNPARYELELQDWKLSSRIQVLVARLSMKSSEVVEQELRQTLAEQTDVREQLLMADVDRARAKLNEAEGHLSEFRSRRESIVEERLAKLLEQARESGSTSIDRGNKSNKK